ncbi:MAG TPA: hypothetical protein VH063_01575 [Gaiellaceae bacterium]|jgi:hypothetical protein|nr:hypothetical protein [Gaiellaceae bacterium]
MSLNSLRSSQALMNAALAGSLAAIVAWFGPPGTDFAAHVFQLHVYLQHGFALWTNYWYAGRYTFVGYSILYYPLAALFGIRLLAVLSVAASTAAFTLVIRQTWGESTVWATRFFAVVAAASVVSAAFPYGLGLALALTSLVAVARRHLVVFGVLAALTLAASPLAFLFLLLVLGAAAVSRSRQETAKPAAIAASICALGLLVYRLFPDHGVYPFATSELLAALTFCGLGAGLTWRLEKARILRALFLGYAAACVLAYLIPSTLGENVVRLRYAALPIAVLTLSLRRWRPLPICAIAFALACSWNISPLIWSLTSSSHDPSAKAAYWRPVIRFLHQSLTPAYRVEVAGTANHWEAVYLPQAGIPIVRGWFRQDDFPQNEVLYDKLTRTSYLEWLRELSVRYVVLTNSAPDYSAKDEIALLRSGRSELPVVFRSAHETVFAVPSPRPIITGPGHPIVRAITENTITLKLNQPGSYRLGIRYTPYLISPESCVTETKNGMTVLTVPHAGTMKIAFSVSATGALAALTGSRTTCAKPH